MGIEDLPVLKNKPGWGEDVPIFERAEIKYYYNSLADPDMTMVVDVCGVCDGGILLFYRISKEGPAQLNTIRVDAIAEYSPVKS